jgi:hypothetical protein
LLRVSWAVVLTLDFHEKTSRMNTRQSVGATLLIASSLSEPAPPARCLAKTVLEATCAGIIPRRHDTGGHTPFSY